MEPAAHSHIASAHPPTHAPTHPVLTPTAPAPPPSPRRHALRDPRVSPCVAEWLKDVLCLLRGGASRP